MTKFIKTAFFIGFFVLVGNLLLDLIIPDKGPIITGAVSAVIAVIGSIIGSKIFSDKK